MEERWLRCLCQRALESILSLFVYNWSCGVRCSTTQNCNNSPFYDDVLTFPKLGCWPGTVTLCMIYCAAEFMPQCWLFLYSKCSSEKKKPKKKRFPKFWEMSSLNWRFWIGSTHAIQSALATVWMDCSYCGRRVSVNNKPVWDGSANLRDKSRHLWFHTACYCVRAARSHVAFAPANSIILKKTWNIKSVILIKMN